MSGICWMKVLSLHLDRQEALPFPVLAAFASLLSSVTAEEASHRDCLGISSNWRPLVFSHWADLYYQYPQLSIQTPWLLTFLPLAETCVTALSPGSKTLVHEDLVALQDSSGNKDPRFLSSLSLQPFMFFSTSALPSLSSFPSSFSLLH